MKILKFILFFLLLIFIAFFLIGLLMPNVKYGHEITVDKSIEEAWAVSQDANKYKAWLEGFKSIELISGEAGQIGSKYKVIVNPGEGQEDFEMIETIESIKENEEVTLHFDSDMMIFNQTITFKEKKGKTVIKSDSDVTGKGLMMKSMFAVMGLFSDSFAKQEAKNFEKLKVLINENTTEYFPTLNVEEMDGLKVLMPNE